MTDKELYRDKDGPFICINIFSGECDCDGYGNHNPIGGIKCAEHRAQISVWRSDMSDLLTNSRDFNLSISSH